MLRIYWMNLRDRHFGIGDLVEDDEAEVVAIRLNLQYADMLFWISNELNGDPQALYDEIRHRALDFCANYRH